MSRPLAIDLYCGAWAAGPTRCSPRAMTSSVSISSGMSTANMPMPGNWWIQDVLTLHGAQVREARLIVASSPCQKYSYMAMPWTRAKTLRRWYSDPDHPERVAELNALFNASFRIQQEASAAAGRHIPLVAENVRGAQPWVGKARWNWGSFYLWGDVPALMPPTFKGFKGIPHRTSGHWTNPAEHEGWPFSWNDQSFQGQRGTADTSRKAASAMIAKIPEPLARHIASVYRP